MMRPHAMSGDVVEHQIDKIEILEIKLFDLAWILKERNLVAAGASQNVETVSYLGSRKLFGRVVPIIKLILLLLF